MQSNYIPWKGYFDLIAAVDEFVLYDDMQFTKRDWRNRNRIKTPQGLKWLTVPVKVKGRYLQKINETEINGTDWMSDHWTTIEFNYKKAPHFNDVASWLKPLYLNADYLTISDLNHKFLMSICDYLGISTKITHSSEYQLLGDKTERLAGICAQAGANEYLTGISAKQYLDEDVFKKQGLNVTWFNYEGYQEYPQLWGEFVHAVSIVDLLFNCGRDSKQYMKYV